MQAEAIRQIDNEHVRVTEWRFAPGAATGWHRHDYDYVIVPIAGGPFRIIGADGEATETVMQSGQSYYRAFGVEHDVVNVGETEQSFVEIELKARRG